jgi:hypothetical protein
MSIKFKNKAIEILALNDLDLSYRLDEDGTLEWLNGYTPSFNDDEITAEVTRLQSEYDNNQYQRDRNYAPTGDQLDMLWHSIDAGEFGDTAKQSEFYIANKAVKDANPKP